MIVYEANDAYISMTEQVQEDGKEYNIQCLTEESVKQLEAVRSLFEHNESLTDVLFYTYSEHRYSILVRPEYEADFIAELFKRQLLNAVRWT